MRLAPVIFILSVLGAIGHADLAPAEGEATLSSWVNEAGFSQRTDEESAAAKFLRDIRPEDFQHSSKKQQNAAKNETTGTGSR